MKYTNKCIVSWSLPWMWRKLTEWGLKLNPLNGRLLVGRPGGGVYLLCERGIFSTVTFIPEDEDLHVCGDNLGLFFALAAMRPDSDLHQWFVYDSTYQNGERPQRFWFRCRNDNVADEYPGKAHFCEKADVRQVISHFKGYDDDESFL